MNHYPHHIGDFNNATRHLTRVERSLYRDMLELYYDTEQPLNSDPKKIARRVLAITDDEREAMNLVLEEFFVLQEDGWHNSRCDAEIAKYQGQIEQASRAGKASAAKRYGKNLTTVERPLNQPEPEPEPEPIKEANASLSSAALSDCPHGEIIDLFAKHLPTLPQPRRELWSGQREKSLAARWRWVLTAKKSNGTRYAEDREQALEFFDRFFAYVATCPLLVGDNARAWTADLGWLVKSENFTKVLQGNYQAKEAA